MLESDAWRQMNADQYCEAVGRVLEDSGIEFSEIHRCRALQYFNFGCGPAAFVRAATGADRTMIHTFDPNAAIPQTEMERWMNGFQEFLQAVVARFGGRKWE